MNVTHYPDPDDLRAMARSSALSIAATEEFRVATDRATVAMRALAEAMRRAFPDRAGSGLDKRGRPTYFFDLVRPDLPAYDDFELRAPGTDDEPWTVPESDPPADRRDWVLAVLIVALVVVAIVWRR